MYIQVALDNDVTVDEAKQIAHQLACMGVPGVVGLSLQEAKGGEDILLFLPPQAPDTDG